MTREEASHDVSAARQKRRLIAWVAFVVALVLVLPMVAYFRNRAAGTNASDETPKAGAVLLGGMTYRTDELFSLGFGDGPLSVGVRQASESEPASTFEMAAPDGQGGVWIVDHPVSMLPQARVRRFSADGGLLVTFTTPAGTVLFTPGRNGDLWVDQAAGGSESESLLHYDGQGVLLGTYVLPPRVYARSISLDSDGRAWVLSEEFLIDADKKTASYSGTLIPIAEPDGSATTDPKGSATPGTFIGADGRTYVLTGTTAENASMWPAFTVTAASAAGTSTYHVPAGLRPYAADAEGRVYAEAPTSGSTDAPGVSSLGDDAGNISMVHIFDERGEVSRLPVDRPVAVNSWSPSAWPAADGTLYSTLWRAEGLAVLASAPLPESVAPSASAKPAAVDARIIAGTQPYSGDPYLAEDDAQRDVWHLVYSGLVSWDASLTPVPDLASAIPAPGAGVSSDGLTVEWRIAPGRTFHDGTAVDAGDVAATYDYLVRTRTVTGSEPFPGFGLIRSVVADGDVVRVTLSQPFGPAPTAFFPYVLPAEIVSASTSANDGLFAKPVGSGPYALERWESDGVWQLVARERDGSAPAIKRLEVVFDAGARALDMYRTAAVPTLWSNLTPDAVNTVRRDAVGEVITAGTGRWWGMLLNASNPLLADAATRRVVVGLYPYREIVEGVLPATASTDGVDPYPPVVAAHDPATPAPGGLASSDASAALESAGWRDREAGFFARKGETLWLKYGLTTRQGKDELVAEQVDAVVAAWSAVGIKATWEYSRAKFYASYPHSGYLAVGDYTTAEGVFPASIDPGWGGLFDPAAEPSLSRPYGLNATHTTDETLARLYAEARASYDPSERSAIGRQITRRVQELGLAAFTRYETRDSAVLAIDGYSPAPYPAGEFWNVASWTLAGTDLP